MRLELAAIHAGPALPKAHPPISTSWQPANCHPPHQLAAKRTSHTKTNPLCIKAPATPTKKTNSPLFSSSHGDPNPKKKIPDDKPSPESATAQITKNGKGNPQDRPHPWPQQGSRTSHLLEDLCVVAFLRKKEICQKKRIFSRILDFSLSLYLRKDDRRRRWTSFPHMQKKCSTR